jgi:Amt family ammonium transporter
MEVREPCSPSPIPRLLSAVALCALPFCLGAAEQPPVDTGNTSWMLVSTALVLFMTLPGLALFYGGLVRSKNVLSILVQCFAIAGGMSILWVLVGYSLAFGDGGPANAIIGGLGKAGLIGVGPEAIWDKGVPETVFIAFQMTFFIITPGLIVGAVAERMKFSAMFLFAMIWGLLCYIPICHQVWGGGWMQQWGVLDLAGGTVVHVTAGVAALVAALMVGRRKGYPEEPMKPHNLTMTMCGTGMLWVGWFGFNAGSHLAAGGGAGMTLLVTHISAATAAIVWMLIEWTKHGKPSALGIATGAIAGLATITPASGDVGPLGAMAIGTAAALGCYFVAVKLKNRLGFDDSLDAFGVHGVGGAIGTVLVAVFAASSLGGLHDADYSIGGQLVKQVVAVAVSALWSAVVTVVILAVLRKITGLRVESEHEDLGLDLAEHDERGYII